MASAHTEMSQCPGKGTGRLVNFWDTLLLAASDSASDLGKRLSLLGIPSCISSKYASMRVRLESPWSLGGGRADTEVLDQAGSPSGAMSSGPQCVLTQLLSSVEQAPGPESGGCRQGEALPTSWATHLLAALTPKTDPGHVM